MCGRYILTSPSVSLKNFFEIAEGPDFFPRWNVAPTNIMPIVRKDKSLRKLVTMRWGLVPPWSRNIHVGSRMINARIEKIFQSKAFFPAFQSQRCIVPANGFYEWSGTRGKRQPYLITHSDKDIIALAGLWERWSLPTRVSSSSGRDSNLLGRIVETYTILTTKAAPEINYIHHRMPIIIEPEFFDFWLQREEIKKYDHTALQKILEPINKNLKVTPVSNRVNNVRNDDSKCTIAIDNLMDIPNLQGNLF